MQRRTAANAAALALALALLLGLAIPTAFASSHSEAPGTAKDRLIDDTDLYAWVSPDATDKVTIVGNWVPLLEPNGGPNFYGFDDDAFYYMNIDNVGDAQDHIRYQFKFRTTRQNPNTFLYNTGVVRSLDDATLNVRQFCTVTRYDDGVSTVLATDVPVAPNFVGPVSMPDYDRLAGQAVVTLGDGTRIFIGPRDDPFFVDLAAIFDLLTIRKVPGNKGKGVDGVGGYNCLTIAIQVPKTRLTRDGKAPNADNGVIGIYDSAERFSVRTLNGDGTSSVSGPEVQVSRLGMPLVNEVVIPLGQKDRFNSTKPTGDGAFLPFVVDPELARLLTALYGIPTPAAPRNDLVAVFLTGIPGLNKPANDNQVPCEMLRLNLTVPPALRPSRFGILAGDIAGFPNGRRPFDDVVDIAERVVAGATAFTPDFNVSPNNQLGDGIDSNDKPFLPCFPYLAPPHNPFAHTHHREQRGRGVKRHGMEFDAEPNDVIDGDETEAASVETAEAPSLAMRLQGANPGSRPRVEFDLPAAGRVSLKVYDLQGRTVRTLLDQEAAPGTFSAQWDGLSDEGARMSPGLYFVRLVAGGRSTDKKVMLE